MILQFDAQKIFFLPFLSSCNLQCSIPFFFLGAFLFRLWRFGRWQEVIVDDYLPLLDNEFAYCGPVGERKEFWAALLEKAFAK